LRHHRVETPIDASMQRNALGQFKRNTHDSSVDAGGAGARKPVADSDSGRLHDFQRAQVGIWAKGFEELQFIPMLVMTPLTFLGGAFYSIDMLPPAWRTVSLFNPVVYLVSGFRWSFYGTSDVGVGVSMAATLGFLLICLVMVTWIFKTGYRLKS
jgi:hypothetical protein